VIQTMNRVTAANIRGQAVDFLQQIANCLWRNGIIVKDSSLFVLSIVFTKTYDENPD
jgi:hypothetical protein